jgi:hypothetical protein
VITERRYMMKKIYEKPVIDVIIFEKEDVVTASPQELDIDGSQLDDITP